MNDKVSVIMATHNTKNEYLDCAIKSILNQTYNNIEFIIVNDGGNNYDFLKSYEDKRIIIINHDESKGLPYSLNEAIEKSTGKYIVRMDSDDISLPYRIEEQVKFMNNNSNIDILGTFYKYFDSRDEFVINSLNNYKEIKSQLFAKNALAHPTVIIRKSFLDDNKLKYSVDYKYSQDFDLWTRSLKYGNIAILPKVCFLYRIHSNQISSSKKTEQMSLYISILERNLNNLNLDKKDITYLKMINELEKVDYKKLSYFIKKAIKNNCDLNFYDKKTFKKILYNFFFISILKNKQFFTLINIKYFKMTINVYNMKYVIRKFYFLIKEKMLYKKRIRGVNIYV